MSKAADVRNCKRRKKRNWGKVRLSVGYGRRSVLWGVLWEEVEGEDIFRGIFVQMMVMMVMMNLEL